LEPFEYVSQALGPLEVSVDISSCGICYSDVAMLDNEWGMSRYPLVPGHEVVGQISEIGDQVDKLAVGDQVGVGWYASSCGSCGYCAQKEQHLCASTKPTIAGRHGGFAEKISCHQDWAIKIPKKLNLDKAGPLFCGGITVFYPILACGVKAGDHVGVVGMGGLGHLAVKFLSKWGCEVTVFTTSESKTKDAKKFGAKTIVSTHEVSQLRALNRSLDFLLVTSYADLNWPLYLNMLSPKGRLHIVGAVPKPIPVPAFALIGGQRSISGSALGSPDAVSQMLDFCLEHKITANTESFPMSEVNKAIAHLRAGKARYRIVLNNDF